MKNFVDLGSGNKAAAAASSSFKVICVMDWKVSLGWSIHFNERWLSHNLEFGRDRWKL